MVSRLVRHISWTGLPVGGKSDVTFVPLSQTSLFPYFVSGFFGPLQSGVSGSLSECPIDVPRESERVRTKCGKGDLTFVERGRSKGHEETVTLLQLYFDFIFMYVTVILLSYILYSPLFFPPSRTTPSLSLTLFLSPNEKNCQVIFSTFETRCGVDFPMFSILMTYNYCSEVN